MPTIKPSEAAIKRAIKASQACGLSIGSVEVMTNGSIRVETQTPDPVNLNGKPLSW
jgi:hypothetical protein